MKLADLVTLEEVEAAPDPTNQQRKAEDRIALDRLLQLIYRLRPMDRQVMLLYLEGMDAESIGEITGLPPNNIRVQIHRAKNILAQRFHQGRAS
jgi:RNA polymerase sigma-70 factor (ECF subfamily)